MDIFEALSRAMVERESFRLEAERHKIRANDISVEIAQIAALVVGEPEYRDGHVRVCDAMRDYVQRLRLQAHEKCTGTKDCHPLEASDGR